MCLIVRIALMIFVVGGFAEAQMCQSQSDCPPDECCVLPQMRRTYPQCSKKQSAGDSCRPKKYNIMVSGVYQEAAGSPEVPYTNVYETVCPCGSGLECPKTNATCQ